MTASGDPSIRPAARDRPSGRTSRVIGALVLREMSTTYGRSPGGYAWAILEPVAMILVMAIGFSLLFRAPSLGTNFLLFYMSGLLPLRFFQQVSQSVGTAVQFNLPLMTYPRVTVFDTLVARGALAVLTQIMVAAMIVTGVFATQDIREQIDYAPVLQSYAACIVLSVGVGMLNCFLLLRFGIWRSLWGIITRPLLLISGVFYIFEDLPRNVQNILWFNPLIHLSGHARSGVYSTYEPQYVSLIYVYFFGLIPMFFGALLLWRHGRDILQR